ncbi:aminoglycoside phosphotransferase [Streptacidiphilus sp. N1-10]|uniref:Aminoglycoside phosphotransferase n=1 Tax=Streptacidiphilus jeojiensis TaxID=3229225 RepID=A0ABV6XP77_9ACTN
MTLRVPPAVAAVIGPGPYTAVPLTHNQNNRATAGIDRIQGPDGSAVRKRLTPSGSGSARWSTSDDPRHWNHWRREYLAYSTGFAATVYADAGLGAPTLLGVEEDPDGGLTLWLEDVEGRPGPQWSVADLADLAHRLGTAQAACAARPPERPWLSHRWLRHYLTAVPDPGTAPDWSHPEAVAAWSEPLRADLAALAADPGPLLAVAESAPQTLCHLDLWPMNLIATDDRTVLLDWSFTGTGAIGEDISNLIVDSVADGLMDPSLLPEIAAVLPEAYLRGLRAGGWQGSDAAVRTAIAASGAAKYSWLAPAMLRRLDQDVTTRAYDRRSPAETLRRRLGLLALVADWARAALGRPGRHGQWTGPPPPSQQGTPAP